MSLNITKIKKLNNDNSMKAFLSAQIIVDVEKKKYIMNLTGLKLFQKDDGKYWLGFPAQAYQDQNNETKYQNHYDIQGTFYFELLNKCINVYENKEQCSEFCYIKDNKIEAYSRDTTKNNSNVKQDNDDIPF